MKPYNSFLRISTRFKANYICRKHSLFRCGTGLRHLSSTFSKTMCFGRGWNNVYCGEDIVGSRTTTKDFMENPTDKSSCAARDNPRCRNKTGKADTRLWSRVVCVSFWTWSRLFPTRSFHKSVSSGALTTGGTSSWKPLHSDYKGGPASRWSTRRSFPLVEPVLGGSHPVTDLENEAACTPPGRACLRFKRNKSEPHQTNPWEQHSPTIEHEKFIRHHHGKLVEQTDCQENFCPGLAIKN